MSVAAINASKKRAQRFYALGFRKPRPHEETRYQLLSKERNAWFKPRGKLARKFEEEKLVSYLGKRIAHVRVDDGKEYFISIDYVKENASVEEEPTDDDEMWGIVELFGDPPSSTSIDLTFNEEEKVDEKMDEILFINGPINGKELNGKMDEILSINGSLNEKELDDKIDQLSSSTESFNGKELDKLLMKDVQGTDLLVNESKSCNDRKRNESLTIND
uniref:Nucleolar protein 16 n=1 Tax=Strongyloides papillosus TaxID=174720 RepID=A0A0N5BMR9_STREA